MWRPLSLELGISWLESESTTCPMPKLAGSSSSTSSSLGKGSVRASFPTPVPLPTTQMVAVGEEDEEEMKLMVALLLPQIRDIGFGDGVAVSKEWPRCKVGDTDEVDKRRLGLSKVVA